MKYSNFFEKHLDITLILDQKKLKRVPLLIKRETLLMNFNFKLIVKFSSSLLKKKIIFLQLALTIIKLNFFCFCLQTNIFVLNQRKCFTKKICSIKTQLCFFLNRVFSSIYIGTLQDINICFFMNFQSYIVLFEVL